MDVRNKCLGVALIGAALALTAPAADKPSGSIGVRPPVPLDSTALNAMLRADRDKDGVLSRQELEHYDLRLSRRFNEADTDRDGKLTFYEFETLLEPPDASANRR